MPYQQPASLYQRLKQVLAQRRDYRQLLKLEDYLLRDMGLNREYLMRESRRPLLRSLIAELRVRLRALSGRDQASATSVSTRLRPPSLP